MLVAKGNLILVAWSSNKCKGGVSNADPDDDTDNFNLLSLSNEGDKFQVKGSQRCHDYSTEVADLEKVPLQCVWAARGIVSTSDGSITWTNAERLTSGRRDPFQLVAAVASNSETKKTAWALAWQEDPKGLRVGEAAGPGDGMSGATVNYKTDIWYSYLKGDDFEKCLEGACVQGEGDKRPTVSTDSRFSTPVRVTDNASCKKEKNYMTGEIGSPKGGPYCIDHCATTSDEETDIDKNLTTCVTEEGEHLNGDTGASRPNMFLIPDGDNFRVVLAYEESKGLGEGPQDEVELEDDEREDWGKNIYYHTFMFDGPDEVAHGTLVNLPELSSNNVPLVSEDGRDFLTRNARRVRMIVQPKSNWGDSQLAMALLYREGDEGHGKPAHIIMRRFIGGYGAENLECTNRKHPVTKLPVCAEGSVDLNADNVPEWNTALNEYEADDARAHRGFLRGDLLVLGYTYTPKWGRGPSRYDFFVRRSFDGGRKFTNAKGNKEDPVNLSNIKEEGNRGWSIMEPRLYATPGTIGGSSPKSASDVQNSMVYFAAYSTTHQPEMTDVGDDGDEGVPDVKDEPMSAYWTMTDNFGETYLKVWNPGAQDDEGKWEYPWLAKVKGDDDPAQFGGIQINANPAGTKLFASFQADIPSNTLLTETGGGPCRGNGVGSAVCFNSTVDRDPTPLGHYDFNGDGTVNAADVKLMQQAMDAPPLDEIQFALYDIDGDGTLGGFDKKLVEAAVVESAKLSIVKNGRRTYLRRRE